MFHQTAAHVYLDHCDLHFAHCLVTIQLLICIITFLLRSVAISTMQHYCTTYILCFLLFLFLICLIFYYYLLLANSADCKVIILLDREASFLTLKDLNLLKQLTGIVSGLFKKNKHCVIGRSNHVGCTFEQQKDNNNKKIDYSLEEIKGYSLDQIVLVYKFPSR